MKGKVVINRRGSRFEFMASLNFHIVPTLILYFWKYHAQHTPFFLSVGQLNVWTKIAFTLDTLINVAYWILKKYEKNISNKIIFEKADLN